MRSISALTFRLASGFGGLQQGVRSASKSCMLTCQSACTRRCHWDVRVSNSKCALRREQYAGRSGSLALEDVLQKLVLAQRRLPRQQPTCVRIPLIIAMSVQKMHTRRELMGMGVRLGWVGGRGFLLLSITMNRSALDAVLRVDRGASRTQSNASQQREEAQQHRARPNSVIDQRSACVSDHAGAKSSRRHQRRTGIRPSG